ncbi:hypothetical protein WS62_18575 [Burkholderia sp. ABCPW 14]|uniref:hypothetical protein n=1 Tax=Burkholderia sp. ABCPW 14 TaxID=1637860 RepID=UPI000770CAC5|nr:hypothetical protein [Burkholderia sp. ABCPW 14]KVD87072.1 hypothetical protein WS62_18575 [Burkholderia sp. ABCPW 14]
MAISGSVKTKKLVARTTAPLTGVALLHDSAHNKGSAFTREERRRLGLEGLLPRAVEPLERRVERVLSHLDVLDDDLARYVYLIDLEARNETVFYKTIMSAPRRFIPILYDPTVADVCLAFGNLYRRARDMKGSTAEQAYTWSDGRALFAAGVQFPELPARPGQ